MTRYRYSRWDGTQDPLGDLFPAEHLADALGDRLLDGMSPEQAMRHLLEEGLSPRFGGLRSLRQRLRRMQDALRRESRLDAVLEELEHQLDEIVALERAELETSRDPHHQLRRAALESLPSDPAGRIDTLRRHDFASGEAERRFTELLERLRRETLDGHLDRMTEGMQNLSPEELSALKDMLADLNRMLEQRRNGTGPSPEEFQAFMDRHGRFFPDHPRHLDQLLEGLARRGAAMSRLLASLSPRQRARLEDLTRSLLDDLDLAFEMDRLGANLRHLLPGLPWDRPADLEGELPLGLGEALAEIEELSEMEELEACLRQDYPGADLEDVDLEALGRRLGDDAVRDLERLRRVERALKEAGVLARREGRLELTPRGIRRLGERALATVFDRLRLDRAGSHQVDDPGGPAEPTGSTRPWRFGDPFRIDIGKTVSNALVREGPSPEGRVALRPDDFQLAEAEGRTSTATVLLLDMSRSMPLRGHWAHAKRMALALHTLIETRYPEDSLAVVGFSDYARRLRPADLAATGWEPVYGTNMEHAFRMAGRILARDPAETKQVLLVTDGEPTAHLVGDRVFFHWPPVPETLERTYREALRLAAMGTVMNVFMLESSPGLVRFVDRLARLVRGRVFAVGDDRLGAFVVRDYLARRGS